jgi:hypothetical protein
MGPRDGRSTAQYGLAQGNVFGLIGSTDHHSAYPGSYGHGRLGVWATELTRAGYLGGVLSPAYRFHRAVPHNRFAGRTSYVHRTNGKGRDWYYARVRQTNGEWAWGSPIWVSSVS